MKFKYRDHMIPINDKVVECYTSFIEQTVTERLFDMYLEGVYGDGEIDIEDIDLSKYTDEELSKEIGDCMLEECQVNLKIKGYWDKEFEEGNLS